MAVWRILVNALIMALELAAIAGLAWIGYAYPVPFAIATALVTLALGLVLEPARLAFELPFYFGGAAPGRRLWVPLVGVFEAAVKAVLAGLVALLTFAGTDRGRVAWVAIALAATLWVGASLLRVLSLRLGAAPARWGYFRLAVLLGLVFSLALAILTEAGAISQPTLGELGRQIIFETPAKPGIEQVSELLFQVKLYIDGVIVALLSTLMPADWARLVGIVVSVNVLTGFVAAVYALLIATVVLRLEDLNG